jgi:DNA-binding LacI/PurR family transcriptional regulator
VTGSAKRVTQQDIARMTSVSQATVSLVLNGRAAAGARIAPATRERVLRVIEETGYVADPIARRLLAQRNQIIGVFTYEALFPTGHHDFYRPFLVGIERQAERRGLDLLLLTSAAAAGGPRRIFQPGSRLRLADGCVLLGLSLDHDDLTRLVADGRPFVAVGRRDDAGGPVPYVGADYPSAVAALVGRAAAAGHRRLAYLGQGAGPESYADRMVGFRAGVRAAGITARHEPVANRSLPAILDALTVDGVTAVFTEEHADAVALTALAEARGLRIPADLSIVTMGQPTRPEPAPTVEFSGLHIPRRQMGADALDLLAGLIDGSATRIQRLLDCDLVDGATLAPPSGASAAAISGAPQ